MNNDNQRGSGPSVSAPIGAIPKAGMLADLGPRFASGIVMIVVALAALWVGSDYFVLFWLCAGLAIIWEWQRMIDAPALRWRVVAGGVALVAITVLTRHLAVDLAIPFLIVGCLVLGWLAGPGKRIWAAGGLVYAAGLVASVTMLRLSLFDGFEAILWLFAVVWGTDIMAYMGGRLIGGPKLWPAVSPKKTWAGFLTGVFCGAALGVAAVWFFHPVPPSNVKILFFIGLATAAVSQGGDLFESAMKRHFGVKDSSQLIPGHGGFMDRLDGFLFAAIFAALIGAIKQGPGAIAIGVLRW